MTNLSPPGYQMVVLKDRQKQLSQFRAPRLAHDLRTVRTQAYTCTMLPRSRKEAGECTGRLVEPYGYAGAMPGLKEWVMDRRGEMVRSAVRCRPGPHLASAVLPGALRHAGEAAYIRCGLPDLGCRPREGRSASPEGGSCG